VSTTAAAGLLARLRTATQTLHAEAEGSAVMAALSRGELERCRSVQLLRALHAVYTGLESALARHASHPLIAPLELGTLARADAISADLDAFGVGMRFCAFGPPEAVRPRTQRLHAALDGLDLDDDAAASLVAEARDAFGRHIRLFGELAAG